MMYPDDLLRGVLRGARTIALIGYSANPARPSHGVAGFLRRKGYRVIPVNPGLAGQLHGGEMTYGDLATVPDTVDMVDVFRQSDAVPGIVDAALARWPDLQTIWLQLGVMHDGAAQVAAARGVTMIQDRCPAIEYPRLFGSAPLSAI